MEGVTFMLSWFDPVFQHFGISGDLKAVLSAMAVACIICFFLRIITFIQYRGLISILPFQKKKVKSKKDVEELSAKKSFLSRIVNDYTEFKNREIGSVDVRAIAEKHIRRLNFLGIPLGAVERFLTSFEWGFLLCGGLLAIISNNSLACTVLIIISYGVLKGSALLFDTENCRETLLNLTICYIDKDISQYFASDTMSAVLTLRNEMKASIDYQTASLSGAIAAMGEKSDGNFKAAYEQIVEICGKAMGAYEAFPAILSSSSDKIVKNTDMLGNALAVLKESAEKYIDGISSQQKSLSAQLAKLNELTAFLSRAASLSETQKSGIEEELAYIRLNQRTLSESLVQYELALKEVASNTGDGLGKIINFHADEGYKRLSDGLMEDFSRIMAGNEQLVARLSEFLDELRRHNKSQASSVIGLKEQMDLSFEAIEQKMNDQI